MAPLTPPGGGVCGSFAAGIHHPWIPAFAGMTSAGAGGIQAYLRPRNTICRTNDEFGDGYHSSRIGVRDMLSYQ